jgi:hypothetical protein
MYSAAEEFCGITVPIMEVSDSSSSRIMVSFREQKKSHMRSVKSCFFSVSVQVSISRCRSSE